MLYDNLERDGSIVVTDYHVFPSEETGIKMMLRRMYDQYHVDYRYKYHYDTGKLVIKRSDVVQTLNR